MTRVTQRHIPNKYLERKRKSGTTQERGKTKGKKIANYIILVKEKLWNVECFSHQMPERNDIREIMDRKETQS